VGILFKTLYSWKLATLVAFLFFFTLNQSYAQDRTLQWDENTDPDLDGYKVYYGLESRYPANPDPYNASGSPIDVALGEDENLDPDIFEYTVTGLLDNEVYFFAVTAIDTDSLESGFSNEEMTLGITWPGGGFYVNDDNDSPYTVRGRADKQTGVDLYYDEDIEEKKLGEATADDNRDWQLDVDFEAEFVEGSVILIVKSKEDGITAPAVTATYDPTDPTSQATSATDTGSFVAITWSASDATSGVASTELWCKPPGEDWATTYLSQGGTSGTFYYTPTQGDGEYFFATRSVDRAGNWEAGANGDGDTSTQYVAPITITGKEGSGGGCFVDTLLPAHCH